MSVKVIFVCSKPLWLDIAFNLIQITGWKPCLWISLGEDEKKIKEKFPKVIFINSFESMKGKVPQELSKLKHSSLDHALLEKLAFHESIVLKMMDLMDLNGSFSYSERIRLYHNKLRYWISVLDHLKPDVFFRPTSPHTVDDYILYVACKIKGIKTIMFKRTSIPGLIYPIRSVEEEPEKIISLYRQRLADTKPYQVQLSQRSNNYLQSVFKQYSEAIPFYLSNVLKGVGKEKNQIFNNPNNILDSLRIIYKLPKKIYSLLQIINNPNKTTYYKEKGKKTEDSEVSLLKYKLVENFILKRKRNVIQSHYDKLSHNVDLKQKYIYVALHCQPERSTSPDGGFFAHQLLMIDILSKTVPEGWYIYVKEHISQFQPYKFVEQVKDITFYDDIASLNNVKLVPLSFSPFELIDNSIATATVSGTSGWESVVRGRPALVFGYAWYRGCEGVFYTPTVESCVDAISKIANGYKVDFENIKLYIYILEQVCTKGFISADWEKETDIKYEQNISSITQAIIDTFNS